MWREAADRLYWECYCPKCHPEAFPQSEPERQNEGHVAVRFGDHAGPMAYSITVDGVDWTNSTIEALSGADGWAWVFSTGPEGKKHRCPCGVGLCQRIITGVVTVEGIRRSDAKGGRAWPSS